MRSFFSSFICLNLTQFFSALNDNIYKLLLVFLLISIHGAENSNSILSLAGAIFVIPFILFASIAGIIADRFSKRSIIFYTRLLEIATASAGVVAFAMKSTWGAYAVLFFMATQSALFSPAKYGIVPEIVPRDRISNSNGILTATTYLAIIIGTFLASFLTQITEKNFVLAVNFCVIVAFLGALTSFGIEKTKPQAETKALTFHFISDVIKTLKKTRQQHYLLPAIIFGSYFLLIGAYTQLNIIPLSLQSLKLSEVEGGYLFLMTAIGIGIGSMFVGKISGRQIELGFVSLSALGVMFCFLILYLYSHCFVTVAITLIFLGIFGGFYIVPIDAFIQAASPDQDRGQNVAASNFMNFIGVIVASGLIAVFGIVFQLKAAEGFLVMSFLTFFITLFLAFLTLDQLARLFISFFAKLFWKISISGEEHLKEAPLLIFVQRRSWLDTVIMMAVLPRLLRYIVPVSKNKIIRTFFYRLLKIIPFDETFQRFDQYHAMEEVKREIKAGHSVCLLQKNEPLNLTDIRTIRVTIKRRVEFSGKNKGMQLFALSKQPINIVFSLMKNESID